MSYHIQIVAGLNLELNRLYNHHMNNQIQPILDALRQELQRLRN